MKKVVMFSGPTHEIPPLKGAAVQTWMYEVSKRIIKYQTHIISIDFGYYPLKEFQEGVYFHRVRFSRVYKRIFQKILGWDVMSYNKRVFNLIKEINPDIVHIHNYYRSFEVVNWLREFNPDIKIILHMHNETDKFKRGYPEVDAFFGCSNYIVEKYKSLINTPYFQTIYNGVDMEVVEKTKKYESIIKNAYKKENEINVCYFGRISPEKGVEKFINLANEMKDYKNYKFHLFGEISTRGDRNDFYKKLLNFVKENDLNVNFYDYIPPHKIHYAYEIADFIVVPSEFEEPFGMVALEALAHEKFLIASYKGGMKEFVDEKNAFVIKDYDNFEKEAKKILLNYENLDKTVLQNAYETAKKFDWMNIALKVEGEYDKIDKFKG